MPTKTPAVYDKALAEARKKSADLGRVHVMLVKAHRDGDPRAAYALGTWFLHGHFLKKDVRKGMSLIRAAASANVSDALFDLAHAYECGTGVPKNAVRAAHAYLRAALYGDKQAVFEVGRCYYYGIGFDRDRKIAQAWLDRARDLGVFNATELKSSRASRRPHGLLVQKKD
jgi:TPR repeat protein